MFIPFPFQLSHRSANVDSCYVRLAWRNSQVSGGIIFDVRSEWRWGLGSEEGERRVREARERKREKTGHELLAFHAPPDTQLCWGV